MNEKNNNIIETDFDRLTVAKQQGAFAIKAVISLAVICMICSLGFAFFAYNAAYSKIAVIDTGGRYLQMTIEDEQNLQKALMQQTCSNLTYYLNSFDRNSMQAHYDKARAYCAQSELDVIAKLYRAEKIYYETSERGVILETRLNRINKIEALPDGNVKADFTSVLTKIDGNIKSKFIIESQGTMKRTTPKYPDNTTGWFFTQYTQTIKPLQND